MDEDFKINVTSWVRYNTKTESDQTEKILIAGAEKETTKQKKKQQFFISLQHFYSASRRLLTGCIYSTIIVNIKSFEKCF